MTSEQRGAEMKTDIGAIQRELAAAAALLDSTKARLAAAEDEAVRSLAGKLPAQLSSPEDGKIKVVLAGQYSAGKSTIVRALTGLEEVRSGEGITTEEVAEYDWGEITLLDTPGVHTGLRADHDERSYAAIDAADLIVFVVTNELFDAHIAEHFRKLAIDRGRGAELLLVVNKMGRAAKGNSEEQQALIREGLREVLDRYTPEQLRTCFVDAQSALESAQEEDAELSAALYEASGMADFQQAVGEFVAEKGLMGRYTTALYQLQTVLQEALAVDSTGDAEIDAFELACLKRKNLLGRARSEAEREVKAMVRPFAAKVRAEGRKLGDSLVPNGPSEDFEARLNAAKRELGAEAEGLQGEVVGKLETILQKMIEGVDAIAAEFSGAQTEVAGGPSGQLNAGGGGLVTATRVAGVAKSAGNKVAQMAIGDVARGGLGKFAGSSMHKLVLEVGHLFGVKFKPWQAIKWAKGIGVAGKVLGVAGAVAGPILEAKAQEQRRERERALAGQRRELIGAFNDNAQTIEMSFDEATGRFVADTIEPVIQENDRVLAEMRQAQTQRDKDYDDLEALLLQGEQIIQTIQGGARPQAS